MDTTKNTFLSWMKAVGFGLLFILIFNLIQMVVSVPVSIGYAVTHVELFQNVDLSNIQEFMMSKEVAEMFSYITTVGTISTGIVFPLWYFLRYGRKNKKTAGELIHHTFDAKKTSLYIIFALFCYSFSIILMELEVVLFPKSAEFINTTIGNMFGANQLLMAFTTILFAPLGEECLFRGIFFKKAGNYLTPLFVVIISSIMFGVFHMNIIQGLYVQAFALLCGYVTYKTDSVLPAIFIHAIYNGTNFIKLLIPEVLSNSILFWIAFAVILLAVGIVLFRRFGYRVQFHEKEEGLE